MIKISMIYTEFFHINTKGESDVINITELLEKVLKKSKLTNGAITTFVTGSTAGITLTEYEPGIIKDLKNVFEKVAPRNEHYFHHNRWNDNNGSSHVKASILGPSLVIPFVNKELKLGQWQSIVLIDFDTREREREVIVQVNGEK